MTPAQRSSPVPAAKLYVKLAALALVCVKLVTVFAAAGSSSPSVAPFRFVKAFVVVVPITGI
jgi:hypothetical protein